MSTSSTAGATAATTGPSRRPKRMGLFRREPVHQRLAREAGMLAPDVETLRPSWDKVGVHGMSRPRTWDAVVTTEAEGIQGDAVEFVTLADGTLVVERE